jgi:hypothetical protein
MAEIDWKREFEELGAAGVRAGLIARRWDEEKRSAARQWLERIDATSWQASRAGANSDPAAKARTGMDVFRRYKWVYYIAAGAFGLLGLSQIFRF